MKAFKHKSSCPDLSKPYSKFRSLLKARVRASLWGSPGALQSGPRAFQKGPQGFLRNLIFRMSFAKSPFCSSKDCQNGAYTITSRLHTFTELTKPMSLSTNIVHKKHAVVCEFRGSRPAPTLSRIRKPTMGARRGSGQPSKRSERHPGTTRLRAARRRGGLLYRVYSSPEKTTCV